MRTYVTILAGTSPRTARPVVSSSHPKVVEAALAAIRSEAGGEPVSIPQQPEEPSSLPAERPGEDE